MNKEKKAFNDKPLLFFLRWIKPWYQASRSSFFSCYQSLHQPLLLPSPLHFFSIDLETTSKRRRTGRSQAQQTQQPPSPPPRKGKRKFLISILYTNMTQVMKFSTHIYLENIHFREKPCFSRWQRVPKMILHSKFQPCSSKNKDITRTLLGLFYTIAIAENSIT